MPTIDVKSAYKVRSKGHIYWYAWRGRGAPRLTAPVGSPAFLKQLAEALEGRNKGDRSRIDGLVIAYKADDAWKNNADSTKYRWEPWLDRIRDHFGRLSIRQFDRPEIRIDITEWRDQWKHTPRSADMGMQVLSAVLSFARTKGKLTNNPCFGIPNLYEADRSDILWTQDDLDALEKVASAEIFRAAKLASLTGLRLADTLALTWEEIGDLAIERKTNKSRSKKSKKKQKVALIPLYGELREFLATCPRTATTVLTTSRGTPWQGWGTGFDEAVKAARLDTKNLHFHDLRGTAATKFYLAGFSIREIAVMLGWSEENVERIIDRYVKRDEILRARIAKLDAARGRSVA